MTGTASLTQALDDELTRLLQATKPAKRREIARKLAVAVRQAQQAHLHAQQTPDGQPFEPRRNKVLRGSARLVFVYQGQVRTLNNFRSSRGRSGRLITGFDDDRGAVRSFNRRHISRYLELDRRAVQRTTVRSDPMFKRLRTHRYLRINTSPDSAVVGFQQQAARIAREHHYGLTGTVNALAQVKYPQRPLLGLSDAEKMNLLDIIYQALLTGG